MKQLILCFLLCCSFIRAFGQVTVTGKVTDEKDNPLGRAVVLEKGTDNGVTTSLDGQFIITVQSTGSVLVFSHTGHTTFEQTADPNNPLLIKLINANRQ